MGLFQKKAVQETSEKTLIVELFDKNNPSYKFKGQWTGRDIMLIGRTIARAYRVEQRAKRRDFISTNDVRDNMEIPTTMEEIK